MFYAQEEAGRLGENYVSTEHLLLGLVRENDSVAARILDRMGVKLTRVRSEIERQVQRGDGRIGREMQLTPRAKRVIDLAYDEARQLSNNFIGTEHLLLGLVREAEGLAGRVLAKLGVDLERTRREVMALQDKESGMPANQVGAVHKDTADARQFAEEYSKLPADQQAALVGDGIPLHKLPEPMREIVQRRFEAGITSGTFVLDPNALVRVNLTRVSGATHYTISASASFLLNMLVTEA